MPAGNASQNSREKQCAAAVVEAEDVSPWTISLGSVGRTRLMLSPAVLPAMAVVVIVVGMLTGRLGNSDLPLVAMIAVGFWIIAWLVQLAACQLACGVCGWWLPDVTINLIGIESIPRRMPALKSLSVSLASLVALVLCGVFYWWADGDFRRPVFTPSNPPIWSPPSIGLSASDSILRVAAWLCWVQALCQMFPLPKTIGRQILAALVNLCSTGLDVVHQVAIVRKCLVAIAVITLMLAISLIGLDQQVSLPRWPLVLVLGVLLWISSNSNDLVQFITGYRLAGQVRDLSEVDEEDRLESVMMDRQQEPVGLVARARQAVQARKGQRRAMQALAQERREADDVARLDEILNRLHAEGPDSLSKEDRVILDRVSQTLQKRRAEEDDSASDSTS